MISYLLDLTCQANLDSTYIVVAFLIKCLIRLIINVLYYKNTINP